MRDNFASQIVFLVSRRPPASRGLCCWYSAGGRKTDRSKPGTTAGLYYFPMEVKNSEGSSGVISIGNSMICSDISRLLYVIWDNFEISRVVFMANFTCKSCYYLFILLPAKGFVNFIACSYWKLKYQYCKPIKLKKFLM